MAMTAIAATGSGARGGAFNGRVMLAIIAAGILSFVGFLFMSAYAPELKRDSSGRSHALSQSAIGYSGLVRLRQALGHKPSLIRAEEGLKTERLVVVTPELSTLAKDLGKLVKDRASQPTLIILPKRRTQPERFHSGWVRGRTIVRADRVEDIIAEVTKVELTRTLVTEPTLTFAEDWLPEVSFGKGTVVQTMNGDDIIPYISDGNGNILLGALAGEDDEDRPIFILSDPDVMNNLGLGNPKMAWTANKILDQLADGKDEEVEFDISLNGFGTSRTLLKLIFEPPFLALSLCLFVASLMALLFGLMRFGPPLRDKRAVAPGKAALVDNTADLLKQAGLELDVTERYANLTRDAAAHDLGLPQGMSAEEVTQRLDRVTRAGTPFSALRQRLIFAENLDDMLAAARALYHWRKDKTQ
jgi:hypothetical protein